MSRTGHQHQLVVTTPTDHEIVMTRDFDAPRALVFDAFTKPEILKRWLLGPDGWSMPVCEVDLRVGGSVRMVWRNDADGTEFGSVGVHREVSPPELLTRTESMEGMPEAIVTTTFVERGGRTTVTMTIRYESKALRDMALESGMDYGVGMSYDRLAGIL